mgnify:CR=1 FL=1
MNRLNFESFRKEYTCYDDISDSWLEWFIGFFEGDGSFIITRSNKELEFVISQYEPNINVLIDIKDKFGFGSVIVQSPRIDRSVHKGKKHKEGVYRFVVQDLKSLHVLCTLFNNGNLILPIRNHKFKNWLEIFNERLNRAKLNRPNKFESVSEIKYQFKERLCFKEDAWLSGFTDSDGCFSFSLLSTSEGFRLRYIIGGKNYSGPFKIKELFEHINIEFFNSLGGISNNSSSSSFLELRLNGVKNMPLAYKYFDNHYPKCETKIRMYWTHKVMYEKCLRKDHLNKNLRKEMYIAWKIMSSSSQS